MLRKYLNEDLQEISTGQHAFEQYLTQALKKENQNVRAASQSDIIKTIFVAQIQLPQLQVVVPLDPTDDECKKLQMLMDAHCDVDSAGNGQQKVAPDGKRLEQYELKTVTKICFSICDMSIAICDPDVEQTILKNMDLDIQVNVVAND